MEDTALNIKKILGKQLLLLAEQSEKANVRNDVNALVELNAQICETVNTILKNYV